MELTCVVPKNTKYGGHRKLRNLLVMEIICVIPKTQTWEPQEPKKSSLTHSLLQAVILIESFGMVLRFYLNADLYILFVLLTVNREVPRKRNVHTDICV